MVNLVSHDILVICIYQLIVVPLINITRLRAIVDVLDKLMGVSLSLKEICAWRILKRFSWETMPV
jgi:hypothetical protein